MQQFSDMIDREKEGERERHSERERRGREPETDRWSWCQRLEMADGQDKLSV